MPEPPAGPASGTAACPPRPAQGCWAVAASASFTFQAFDSQPGSPQGTVALVTPPAGSTEAPLTPSSAAWASTPPDPFLGRPPALLPEASAP